MATRKIWTEADIRALGARIEGRTACEIVYGVGRTRAYEILRSGDVGFRVIKVPGSNRYVVPTSEILRMLFDDGALTDASSALPDSDDTRMHLVSDTATHGGRRRAG